MGEPNSIVVTGKENVSRRGLMQKAGLLAAVTLAGGSATFADQTTGCQSPANQDHKEGDPLCGSLIAAWLVMTTRIDLVTQIQVDAANNSTTTLDGLGITTDDWSNVQNAANSYGTTFDCVRAVFGEVLTNVSTMLKKKGKVHFSYTGGACPPQTQITHISQCAGPTGCTSASRAKGRRAVSPKSH